MNAANGGARVSNAITSLVVLNSTFLVQYFLLVFLKV